MNRIIGALIGVLYVASQTVAQDSLQTIETKHARIHFDQDYQAFAQEVARKIEPIYESVSKLIGFTQNEKIDLLIGDDFHQANGYAVVLTAGKIVKIYTSAPRSEDELASFSDWLDLVLSHELAHKIHLSEPSRSWRSRLDPYLIESDFFNLMRYPRWVTEGYATIIESEFTQQGRVKSDYVKAMLQQWALEGQLPSYGELEGSDNYKGNRMAYYQGSAFLYWLQENYGQEKLRHLWRRSTAVKFRNFKQAFKGLFLQTPNSLYKNFVAEQNFLARQGQVSNKSNQKLWQDNEFEVLSSEPAPNQNKLLQLERDKKGFYKLSIFDIADNKKAKQKFIEKNQLLIKNDPIDVVDTMPWVFNREAELVIKPAKKLPWRQASWLDDQHILVLQSQKQENGEQGFELASVDISNGAVTKITETARIHDYAITPDKSSVIAITHFAGFNQLVKISLTDGSSEALAEKRLNQPMDNLVINPDGTSLALMAIHQKHWRIHLYSLKEKQWQIIQLPIDGNYTSHLRWQKDGLYFSHSASQGDSDKNSLAVNIYRLNIKQKTWQQLTQGFKLATHAASKNNQLMFLVTSSQGRDTYMQDIDVIQSGEFKLLSIAKTASIDKTTEFLATKNYAFGPQSYTASALSGYVSQADSGFDFVVRGGDPLGRFRWQGALTNGTLQKGGAISLKSNWFNFDWFAEIVDIEYHTPLTIHNNKILNIEIARNFDLSQNIMLGVAFGAGTNEVDLENTGDVQITLEDQDDIDSYHWQSNLKYRNAFGKISYGFSLDSKVIDYQGEQQDWQRNDYGLGLLFGYEKNSISYQFNNFELDEIAPIHSLLNYGGQTTTTTSQVSQNYILNARLPLFWQTGHQFKQHKIDVRFNGYNLFYLNHKTDDNKSLTAYGMEINMTIDNISPLLDGSVLKAGISWYESENLVDARLENEHQFYLSGSYKFK